MRSEFKGTFPDIKSLGYIMAVLLAGGDLASAALTLADQGKSPYRIVLATNAIPSERYAAEELQRCRERRLT